MHIFLSLLICYPSAPLLLRHFLFKFSLPKFDDFFCPLISVFLFPNLSRHFQYLSPFLYPFMMVMLTFYQVQCNHVGSWALQSRYLYIRCQCSQINQILSGFSVFQGNFAWCFNPKRVLGEFLVFSLVTLSLQLRDSGAFRTELSGVRSIVFS